MHDRWLSNTYLVADELGSHAVMIDAGGPVEPLLRLLERMRFQLTHVLLTHHHHDHVAEVETVRERWPQAEVLIHPAEREAVAAATGTMLPGQSIHSGALEIEPIHTPGHTAGMLSLLVSGTELFTGDTLFRRSVAGCERPATPPTRICAARSWTGCCACRRPPASTPATASPPPWPRSSSTTRSCASGAGWTPRATSPAPRSAVRPG